MSSIPVNVFSPSILVVVDQLVTSGFHSLLLMITPRSASIVLISSLAVVTSHY